MVEAHNDPGFFEAGLDPVFSLSFNCELAHMGDRSASRSLYEVNISGFFQDSYIL